jgi:hypothetical protein
MQNYGTAVIGPPQLGVMFLFSGEEVPKNGLTVGADKVDFYIESFQFTFS